MTQRLPPHRHDDEGIDTDATLEVYDEDEYGQVDDEERRERRERR